MLKRKVVEVFKTNIDTLHAAELVTHNLKKILPDAKINFDLDDCDHILRIELRRTNLDVLAVVNCVKNLDLEIEVLE